MQKFEIKKAEFITLVQLLKIENKISSGGEISFFMEENEIHLNGISVFEKRKKIYPGDILDINGEKYEFYKA
jgi:ribosome-associated protein